MTSPGDADVVLGSQSEAAFFAGWTLGPGRQVDLECQPPTASQWQLIGSTFASLLGYTKGGDTVYSWGHSQVIPAQCWGTPVAGISSARVRAMDPETDSQHHRIKDVDGLYSAVVLGLRPVVAGSYFSRSPGWTTFHVVTATANPIAGAAAPAVVANGFLWAEGPMWRAEVGLLYFSDLGADVSYTMTLSGVVEVETPAGGRFANGLALLPDGGRIQCEHRTQRVTRLGRGESLATGDPIVKSETILATEWAGQTLNSPNDAAIASDGTIYFTDPTYGSLPGLGDVTSQPLGFRGVYRIDPGGDLHLAASFTNRQPNGIVLSPDGSTLYVADTEGGEVLQFVVNGDGTTQAPTVFATSPGADGMAIDVAGNVYVAGGNSVRVFAPNGTLWGSINGVTNATNCTFGGPDNKTLYITTRSSVYQVDLQIPGAPPA